MNIAIYHPSLNLFGGGEAVALTIASEMSRHNKVDILTHYAADKNSLEEFFDLDLSKVNIRYINKLKSKLPVPNSVKSSILLRSSYKVFEEYDLTIDTCTNGWFDKKLKTKTICYIHFPFFHRRKKGFKRILNPFIIKPEHAFKYNKMFCNSNFTKSIVEKMTDKPLEILYPPVQVKKIRPKGKKLNRIVTIGRFTYEKKHEIMINAFKELAKHIKDYELHLIGSLQENEKLYDVNYFNDLRELAKGYPIFFHVNMEHKKVLRFLEESKIYWHARGFGEVNPNEYENFGITTVEAMAAGCVPVVINLGAQPEIVNNGKSGFCWNSVKDLIDITKKIVSAKNEYKYIKEAMKDSKKYGSREFIKKFKENGISMI